MSHSSCHNRFIERHVFCPISRFGLVNWPPRSCDLTPLDYFLWGYVKSLVYADKPQTLDRLEDNIRRVIADVRPQMLEKVIENWTSRLDYIRAGRGIPMPAIIFKLQQEKPVNTVWQKLFVKPLMKMMEKGIAVAVDGSWQKRGFSLKNGFTVTSVDTGKVIDVEVFFKTLYLSEQNSSIFKIVREILKATANKVYGDHCSVEKLECIGHVMKRMGHVFDA
ncbi:putative LOC100569746 [Trichonephila clavipes]|nr:putative LOC100569746 [Trichonephila clavipes]